MKISVILIDWGVRESFHSVYYLNQQDRPRDEYEIIWLEYSSRKVDQLQNYYHDGMLDQYIILGNETPTYNKHVAWNEAVVAATGEVVVLCDSDVMFKETFITSVKEFFETNPKSFLLLDEIRNNSRKFWPFSFPTWEEVLETEGVINWDYEKKTTVGIAKEYHKKSLMDRLTHLNYGACFCVKREDYIRYGGLDEHETYNGYICGPYELAFRLLNAGFQESWHESEYLLHTYHPWIRLGFDLIGPHYQFNSLTSLKNWFEGHEMPIVENRSIARARNPLFPIDEIQESIRLSVVSLGSKITYKQRFHDALSRAYSRPFEVIYVEDSTSDSLERQVEEAVSKASGELVLIAPAATIFHVNSLDRFFDNCFLQNGINLGKACVTRTDSDGYDWHFSPEVLIAQRNACEISEIVGMLNSNGQTVKELISADIWSDTARNRLNHSILVLLNQLNEFVNEFRQTRDPSWTNKLSQTVRDLSAIEQSDPGSILHHSWLGGISIHSVYSSLALFRELEMREEARIGLEMLVNSGELLLQKLESKKSEVAAKKWVYDIFYEDFNKYIALSHFHLGTYFHGEKNDSRSLMHLNQCLKMMPEHQESQLLLSRISKG